MFRHFRLVSLATLVTIFELLAVPTPVLVSAAAQPGLASIIGTFNCITHENTGTIWRFHSVNLAWGDWVRADTTFAPQNGKPADTASTYVGFDAASRLHEIQQIARLRWLALDRRLSAGWR
jgi:hypothetical protein